MTKRETLPLALTQHRLIALGYTRLTGLEYASGQARWDMGGVIERPRFRDDGAPKLSPPPGFYDIEMETRLGVRLAVQCTSLSNIASRVRKTREHPDYLSWEGFLEVWGWRTRPDADGGYRLRIVDPRTGLSRMETFYPENRQAHLELVS